MTQRKRISQKAKELQKEFEALKKNPRLIDILKSFFLYDGEIDAPSENLVSMISGAILRDRNLLKKLEESNEEEGIAEIAALIAKTKTQNAIAIADQEASEQVTFSLLYPDDGEGERISRWWRLVDTFRNPKHTIDRVVAQKVIDVMVARAIWHVDYQSLEALAKVNKEFATNSYERTTAVRLAAREIILHEGFLKRTLGRNPSKTEIREFLLGIDDSLSDSSKTWSAAFKLLGWSSKNDRKLKSSNRDTITKIIRKYRAS